MVLAQSSSDFTAVNLQVTVAGHPGLVTAVAFSPDGQLVATGGTDGTARLWNVSTGQEIMKFTGHTSSVESVAFSPDGRTLATGSGRTLATGGYDKTARLWNVSSGQEIKRLTGNFGDIYSVAFSPDGTRVATGSIDTARIYGTSDFRPVFDSRGRIEITAPSNASITINNQSGASIQVLPAGLYVVTVSVDGFKSFTQTVTITANQTTRVTATLEPVQTVTAPPALSKLASPVATTTSQSIEARVAKILALAQTNKLTGRQLLALKKLIEEKREPVELRDYLDGKLSESEFLDLVYLGFFESNGVPKGKP